MVWVQQLANFSVKDIWGYEQSDDERYRHFYMNQVSPHLDKYMKDGLGGR
jgi:hypothetical protein